MSDTTPRMNLYRSILALAVIAIPFAQSVEVGEWQLVWADEFDQDGLPNSQWWDYEEGYIRNNEVQYYTTKRFENARVEDGLLIIEARQDNFEGNPVTSASLSSIRSASWTYGKVEVRAQVATGRGTWPAIWMLGENINEVGWPDCGEIDIMEFVGYDPNTVHGTVHTGAYNHILNTQRAGTLDFDDLETAMHTYGVEWEEDEIRFYIDGENYFTFENDGNENDDTWPFHRPQYLKLNLAIGGDWGGVEGIDNSIYPSQFKIDYVRVYQRKTAGPYEVELSAQGPGQLTIDPEKSSYADGEKVIITADPDVGMRLGKWKNIQPKRALKIEQTIERDLHVFTDFVNPNAQNTNPDFANGLDGWYNFIGESANATISIQDNAAKINITQAAPQAWQVQFGQGGLQLEQGATYQLEFDAWSPNGHSAMLAGLTMNAEPYTTYTQQNIQLTNLPQRFTIDYTHNSSTNSNSRIEFDLAGDTGIVQIDNVVLSQPGLDNLPPYEAWKRDLNIRPIDDLADPDLDGIPNAIEYLLETEPTTPNRAPLIGASILTNNNFSVQNALASYSKFATSNFSISYNHSNNLTDWTPATESSGLPSDEPIYLSTRVEVPAPIAD